MATVINTASDVSPGSPMGYIPMNVTSITMVLAGIAADFHMNANYLDTGSMVGICGSYMTDS